MRDRARADSCPRDSATDRAHRVCIAAEQDGVGDRSLEVAGERSQQNRAIGTVWYM